MSVSFGNQSSQSYAARLAMNKGLWDAFEFKLFNLDTLWERFAGATSDAEVEAALEAAIELEIELVTEILQFAEKGPMSEPRPMDVAPPERTGQPFWNKILKR